MIKLKTGKRKGAVLDVPFWVGKDQIRRGNAIEYKRPKPAKKAEKAPEPEQPVKKPDKEKESPRAAGKASRTEEQSRVAKDGGRKMADKPDNKLLAIDKNDK